MIEANTTEALAAVALQRRMVEPVSSYCQKTQFGHPLNHFSYQYSIDLPLNAPVFNQYVNFVIDNYSGTAHNLLKYIPKEDN